MKKIRLFDYQEDMLSQIGRALGTHRSVMVQMPTGTGKTYLLAAVVKSEAQRVENPCVWIVAHRRELVAQIKETLARFGLPASPTPSISPTSLASPSGDASPVTPHHSFVWVMSIQWLSLHYREIEEKPSLIVIDEAHHALAKTYAGVMNDCPDAKKLGLTATPCRLNGKGFTDLFDVLLSSWSVERFIAEKRLSLYDYYSISTDSEDQRLIDSVKKRGADGDYQQKALSDVMDVRPTIERLCQTIKQYVPKKKGIVYAVSIKHAEHIAEFYREHGGINAVAISSRTPLDVRQKQIAQFKAGEIQVLVSVDLFSEGFDCPDVEFIQLARPTLSLSKYLQMAGRGLRVARGKRYCVFLDNVGLYRRFGLPSADRDWQRMFEGRTELDRVVQEACLRINLHCSRLHAFADAEGGMTKIVGHDWQRQMTGDGCGDEFVADGDGWTDLRSGLRFAKRPLTVRLLGVEFCTDDGMRFYPRIGSRFIDDKAYINLKTLELQVGRGINWKRKYISADEPGKVYQLQDKLGSVRLYVDDEGKCYAQGNPDMKLTPVSSQDDMNAYCQKYSRKEKAAAQKRAKRYGHGCFYPVHDDKACLRDGVQKGDNDILHVHKDVHGESYWVDGISGLKHYARPVAEQRGFVKLLREDDWMYVRNIPDLGDTAFRNWQVVADDNVCVINNEFLFLKQEPRLWFKIFKHTDDFSYFVVKEYYPGSQGSYDGMPYIFITQDRKNGLKMECNGVPYMPYYQAVMRSEIRRVDE